MIKLPNSDLRRRIGLDDHRYGFFADQLRHKGHRSLGYLNGITEGSADDLFIKQHSWLEIYNTGAGYSIWVSEEAKCFYEVDSGD
jgi:hypothetical protein